MHCSPLRYPGGKTFLASEFARILDAIGMNKPIYVEPYAGGAGAALTLLFADKVERIVINDYDKAIYSFWKAVTEDTSSFVRKIYATPVTTAEWEKQKNVYRDDSADMFKRGFATFFLNRTNVSGVMNAWPIGGIEQEGTYKIDARFNKKNLVAKVRKIGRYKDRIEVRKDDGIKLSEKYLDKPNTFIYLDPPYFQKGACLYMNHYKEDNHAKLAAALNTHADARWILTYDDVPQILDLYAEREGIKRISLSYRVRTVRRAKELMISSDPLKEFLEAPSA